MTSTAALWLLFNIISIVVLAFYSMMEMAAVSINKVRLHYWVSTGSQRAQWLSQLLQNPSKLFGTTLIGVNLATVVGSECAREFYSAMEINPNFAPLTQVLVVVILGELAPMFAARQYPEHVATLGVPIVYGSSKVLTPIIWVLSAISKLVMKLFGANITNSETFLSQEELEMMLELREDESHWGEGESEDLNAIASNIFRLKGKGVLHVMTPLTATPMLPSNATVGQLSPLLQNNDCDYIPIYYKDRHNIVAIARAQNLIKASDLKRIRDYAPSPWFVTQNTSLNQLLKQFRYNREDIAVIVNQKGHAVGTVTLAGLLEEVFGKEAAVKEEKVETGQPNTLLRNKTFKGSMTVKAFNRKYQAELKGDDYTTLAELVANTLAHSPERGDIVVAGGYEIVVKETSFFGIKTVEVSSRAK